MEDKKWCVYKHTNEINKKVYIGITCRDVGKRWKGGYGYVRQKKFYRAIQKYGWNNFKHEILFSNLSHIEACDIEIELIQKYQSYINKKGYNITFGGQGTYGYKASKKVRKKISKAKKGKGTGCNNANSKMVVCLTDSIYFKTVEDAALYGGVTDSHIADVCNGKRKYSGKSPVTRKALEWIWYDKNEQKDSVKEFVKENYDFENRNKIICLELLIVYDSLTDANNNGFCNTHGHVKCCCDGKTKTVGGYHWMYYEDYLKLHNETEKAV